MSEHGVANSHLFEFFLAVWFIILLVNDDVWSEGVDVYTDIFQRLGVLAIFVVQINGESTN